MPLLWRLGGATLNRRAVCFGFSKRSLGPPLPTPHVFGRVAGGYNKRANKRKRQNARLGLGALVVVYFTNNWNVVLALQGVLSKLLGPMMGAAAAKQASRARATNAAQAAQARSARLSRMAVDAKKAK